MKIYGRRIGILRQSLSNNYLEIKSFDIKATGNTFFIVFTTVMKDPTIADSLCLIVSLGA